MSTKERVKSMARGSGLWTKKARRAAAGWRRRMVLTIGPRDNLIVAVSLTALGLAIFGAVAWWLIGFALWGDFTSSPPRSPDDRREATQVALTMVAGLGGAVALVVTYRRQKRAEAGSFLERLSTAAGLLGHTNPTIQVSGIYALAALADESRNERQQQCIAVLCGYLRLPYFPTPATGSPHPALTTTKRTHSFAGGSAEVQTTVNHRPSDGEIRRTILDVIRQHLQPGTRQSWSDNEFNFQGAIFDGGILSGAVFRGLVDFRNAQFVGGTVNFGGAMFSGGTVNFGGAMFSGGTVDFNWATFSGGTVNFGGAMFSGGTVNFGRAMFTGGTVDFNWATFSGGTVHFNWATFAGGNVDFTAKFSGGKVDFDSAKFTGGNVDFGVADFSGGIVDFSEATFSGGNVDFGLADFSGGTVYFNSARFTGGTVDFNSARFTGGTVDFNLARFSGGTLDFRNAQFVGGTVNFTQARFTDGTVTFAGADFFSVAIVDFTEARFSGATVDFTKAVFSRGTVDFRFPLDWSVPPLVHWDYPPPKNVQPQELPFIWHHQHTVEQGDP